MPRARSGVDGLREEGWADRQRGRGGLRVRIATLVVKPPDEAVHERLPSHLPSRSGASSSRREDLPRFHHDPAGPSALGVVAAGTHAQCHGLRGEDGAREGAGHGGRGWVRLPGDPVRSAAVRGEPASSAPAGHRLGGGSRRHPDGAGASAGGTADHGWPAWGSDRGLGGRGGGRRRRRPGGAPPRTA